MGSMGGADKRNVFSCLLIASALCVVFTLVDGEVERGPHLTDLTPGEESPEDVLRRYFGPSTKSTDNSEDELLPSTTNFLRPNEAGPTATARIFSKKATAALYLLHGQPGMMFGVQAMPVTRQETTLAYRLRPERAAKQEVAVRLSVERQDNINVLAKIAYLRPHTGLYRRFLRT